MNKTAVVSARINLDVKIKAKRVLNNLGLTTSEVINLLFDQIILQQGIPFPVEIPNAQTMKAIVDTDAGIDVTVASSVEELRAQLGH